MREIYVIGSMSMDLVVQSEKRPAKGETILGDHFFMTTGGKGANQAVSAARLGANVHMVGCVGDDTFGETIVKNLVDNGVHVENVETIPHCASGTAHITLADQDNSIIVVPSANFKVTKELVDQVFKSMKDDAIILIQNEIPKDVTTYIIETAYEKGITVVYNPAPFIEMDVELLKKVTYFTPNETEVEAFFGSDYESIIKDFDKQLIVTLGDKGAVFYDEALIHVPSIKADVVDTTGAGDTFNGAFAVGLSEGMNIQEAIQFANKAASISVTGLGAQGGMPYRKDMN